MYRYGIKAMWAFKNEKETAKTATMPKKVRWLWPFHTPFLCPRTKRDLIDLFTYLCWINQWFEGNNIFLSWILTVFSTVKVRQCKDNGPFFWSSFFYYPCILQIFLKIISCLIFQKYINLSSCDNFSIAAFKNVFKRQMSKNKPKNPPKTNHIQSFAFGSFVICLKDSRRFNSRNTDWSRLTICRSKTSIWRFA